MDVAAPSPFGETLSVLLTKVTTSTTLPFQWRDDHTFLDFDGKGTSTMASFTISVDASTGRFVNQEVSGDSNAGGDIDCVDYLEVDGTAQLNTEDGWIAETSLPIRLRFFQRDPNSDSQEGTTIVALWQVLPEAVRVDALSGMLPEGISKTSGVDFFEAVARDNLEGEVRLEIQTRSVIAANGAIGVGIGVLGCGTTTSESCASQD